MDHHLRKNHQRETLFDRGPAKGMGDAAAAAAARGALKLLESDKISWLSNEHAIVAIDRSRTIEFLFEFYH